MTTLLKHTNLKTAYRTNNSIESDLEPKVQTTNKYLASGVYKLTCADCGKPYVGQTGRISLKGTKNIIEPLEITTPPNSPNTLKTTYTHLCP
jgi:hypothetical protein